MPPRTPRRPQDDSAPGSPCAARGAHRPPDRGWVPRGARIGRPGERLPDHDPSPKAPPPGCQRRNIACRLRSRAGSGPAGRPSSPPWKSPDRTAEGQISGRKTLTGQMGGRAEPALLDTGTIAARRRKTAPQVTGRPAFPPTGRPASTPIDTPARQTRDSRPEPATLAPPSSWRKYPGGSGGLAPRGSAAARPGGRKPAVPPDTAAQREAVAAAPRRKTQPSEISCGGVRHSPRATVQAASTLGT